MRAVGDSGSIDPARAGGAGGSRRATLASPEVARSAREAESVTEEAGGGHLTPALGRRLQHLAAVACLACACAPSPHYQRDISLVPTARPHDLALGQRRYAVVVGIGEYASSTIPRLRYAQSDALQVRDFLVNRHGGGFEPANVTLLLNDQATQLNIKSALGTVLARKTVKGDDVFIYYAGHGATEPDLSRRSPDGYAKYLVPYDADPTDLYASAIPMTEIDTFFDRIESERLVFVMDACYAGAGGRGFTVGPSTRAAYLSDDFLRHLSAGRGRVILAASDVNEASIELDDLGGGIFTHYFLEGVRGAGDVDGDGAITVKEAYDYLYERVSRTAKNAGGVQNPVFMAESMRGDIVLATVAPRAVPATAPVSVKTEPRPMPGMTLVPAGSFTMGRKDGASDEGPPHRIDLPAFSIGIREVTNDEYAAFVRATGSPAPATWTGTRFTSRGGDEPVSGISWQEAMAYASWKGARLPTEPEWERAAKLAQEGRIELRGAGDGPWEWTADWYEPYPGSRIVSSTPRRSCKVLRGGRQLLRPAPSSLEDRFCADPSSRIRQAGIRLAASP